MSLSETKPNNPSNIPILGEGFQEDTSSKLQADTTRARNDSEDSGKANDGEKSGMRKLFGFAKKIKKDDTKAQQKKSESQQNNTKGIENMKATSSSNPSSSQSSPKVRATTHPYQHTTSPSRAGLYSSSPRIISPAGSQIFERDVQESPIPAPNSPAIPSHIQTENRIPPVLDASSEAITNSHLDPDSVEIVTHTAHLPAAASVAGATGSEVAASVWSDDSLLLAHPEKEETSISAGSANAPNYGTLDSSDVRRLSFISFADVVQSEQAEHIGGNRDSMHVVAGLTSLVDKVNRSPSPVRSHMRSTPPASGSVSPSNRVNETSPNRIGRSIASPMLNYPSPPGELSIETMSHSIENVKKGDILPGARSPQPLSPVSSTEGMPR